MFKKLLQFKLVVLACIGFNISSAYAGNGATIIMESGIILNLREGYERLRSALKEFNDVKGDHYFVELKVDGQAFFIDAGRISALCRDSCRKVDITFPKRSAER